MTTPPGTPARRPPRFRFVRSLQGACCILALSVGGTLVAWRYTTLNSLEVQRDRFHAETRQMTTAVNQQIDLFLDALRGLQGLYAASTSVERDGFAAYVRQTDFLARYPAVVAVGFVERVTAQDRDAFVVAYREPMDERVLGLDLASDPDRREAFERARDTSEPAATGRLAFLSDPSRIGVAFAFPLYRPQASASSVEERRRALVGFVAGGVDTESLFRTVGQHTHFCPDIALRVFDASPWAAEGSVLVKEHLLYDSHAAAGATERPLNAPLRGETVLTVGGRTWLCEFTARPECPFLKPKNRTPLLVLALGLLFSLLGFGMLASLATSRLRAVRLAEGMTQAWRTNQELLMARTSQQTAVAELSQQALTDVDLSTLFDYAVGLVAKTLHADLCEVLELLPDGTALQLRAGVGWPPGLMGQATVPTGADSPAGSAMHTGGPVVVEDLRMDTRFSGPSLWREQGVVSGMSVVIPGSERPFGVLGAHARSLRGFGDDDVRFLQHVANVLAVAIHRRHLEGTLRERSVELERNNAALTRQQTVMQSLLEDVQTSKGRLEAQQRSLEAAHQKLEQSLADLQSTQMQLIQAEKLESVGRLAAGVAHEVKNPLAVILMGTEYLTKRLADVDGTTQSVLRDMSEAVKRADRVIKGLLDFSASRELEVGPQALQPIIGQALLLVKHELMRGRVTAVARVAKDLPPLALDQQKIEQVFVNLFTNAVHAMPEGGTLTVTTAVTRCAEVGHGVGRRATDRFRVGEEAVTVTVEDTGAGIPADKLPKIFDPFFTTKPPGEGTGLGLTVTQKIIELHGGTIAVANRPEGGVRVTMLLPIPRGAAKVR